MASKTNCITDILCRDMKIIDAMISIKQTTGANK